MKSVAFVLLVCSACEPDPSELDYPVQPNGTGAFASGSVPGDTAVDAGVPGDDTPDDGDGGIADGGVLSDGGLGPDAAPQLDGGFPEGGDASVPPLP